MDYPKVIGTYYTILGTLACLLFIIGKLLIAWDIGFLLGSSLDLLWVWILLGPALKNRNHFIRIFSIFYAFALIVVFGYEFSSSLHRSPQLFFNITITNWWEYIFYFGMFSLYIFPAFSLLSPSSKAQFEIKSS